jgi:predicted RNA-binding protein YlxR (DUF448 family)
LTLLGTPTRVVPITIAERERVPVRTCVGCRQKLPSARLRRCVLSPEGIILLDESEAGRGAWLCGPECVDAAVQRRAFERAWRRPLPRAFDETMIEDLQRRLRGEDRQMRHDETQLEGGDEHAEEHPST